MLNSTSTLQRRHSKQPVVLATYENNRINLSESAIYIIQNSIKQSINLICLQNFLPKNYHLFSHSTQQQKQKYDNCILLHTYMTQYTSLHKTIIFTELIASSTQAKEILNTFITCVAYAVLVGVGVQDDLRYLGAVNGRVGGLGGRGQAAARTAGLFCLLAKSGERGQYLRDKTDELMSRFELNGTLQNIINSYPVICGLQCPQSCLIQQNQLLQQKIMEQIDSANRIPRDSSELMYGPIFTSYMQNIVNQLNSNTGPINLLRAQNDIVIDQGYTAYRAAVKKYHQVALQNIDANARPDDNQLQQIMTTAKSQAFKEFYAYEGSNNLQYRRMLEEYTKQKGDEVVYTYSSEQWNKNLQILQSESAQVLNKISASKLKDPNIVMGYIGDMTRTYERNARGPQKYEILNDYMKVFTPLALEDDPEKQKRLKQEIKRNQELQQRINELKKNKSGGCCSKCNVM